MSDDKVPRAEDALYTREEYLTPNTTARKDLELVMIQTGSDEEHAINALLKNRGDIVNAIMDLVF